MRVQGVGLVLGPRVQDVDLSQNYGFGIWGLEFRVFRV